MTAVSPHQTARQRKLMPMAGHFSYHGERRYNGFGEWTTEFTVFFWKRFFILAVMTIVPGLLAIFSAFFLAFYLLLVLPPTLFSMTRRVTRNSDTDNAAFQAYNSLTGMWKEYGLAFYTRIWDCDYSNHVTSPSHQFKRIYNVCPSCDKCMTELHALKKSQDKAKAIAVEEASEPLFEASEQFRKAVEQNLEGRQSKIMEEITESLNDSRKGLPMKKRRFF